MASRRAWELEAAHVALNPSALKLQITSRTRCSLVNATFAIATVSAPCAGPHHRRSHAPADVQPPAHSQRPAPVGKHPSGDRKSTRLNSSHGSISYAVFCLKKKKT